MIKIIAGIGIITLTCILINITLLTYPQNIIIEGHKHIHMTNKKTIHNPNCWCQK